MGRPNRNVKGPTQFGCRTPQEGGLPSQDRDTGSDVGAASASPLILERQRNLAPFAKRALRRGADDDPLPRLLGGDERAPLAEGDDELSDLLLEVEDLARPVDGEGLAVGAPAPQHLELEAG